MSPKCERSAKVIAQLQRASSGDHTLDEAIAKYLGWQSTIAGPVPVTHDLHHAPIYWRLPNGKISLVCNWTSNLEAALTLVPQGYGYVIGKGSLNLQGPMFAAIIFGTIASIGDGEGIGSGEHFASLAIAVCIAALMARESLAQVPT